MQMSAVIRHLSISNYQLDVEAIENVLMDNR